MKIEDELTSFLQDNLKELAKKTRDIDIISYYYGFRGVAWPTLEKTAEKFGLKTRQDVHQLLKKKFIKLPKYDKFVGAARCAEILSEKKFISVSKLTNKLEHEDLVSQGCNVQGLLNLLHDLGLVKDYEAYTVELKKASKEKINKFEEIILADKEYIKKLKEDLKKIRTLPGQLGIANLDYLNDRTSNWGNKREFFKFIIENTEGAWFKKYKGAYWYVFENRDNILVNYSEKVFSKHGAYDVDQLAGVYRNALDKRSVKFAYPEKELIKEYLVSSTNFEVIGSTITFKKKISGLNAIELNAIENDVFDLLTTRGTLSFTEISRYLLTKGYGVPNIDQSILHSPFVVVDRSSGRAHYKYRLLSPVEITPPPLSESRYYKFRSRLFELFEDGTDQDVESRTRREQSILRLWLKEGKTQEKCAICGKTFNIDGLIVAHKKDRAKCTEAERLDPYIVMPLCTFGCDYLYGKKLIYIINGEIHMNKTMSSLTEEFNIASALVGKKISKEWLSGNPEYFYVDYDE